MREAAFILPHSPEATKELHAALRAELVERFKGYTAVAVDGAWKSPSGEVISEPSTEYRVALPVYSTEGLSAFYALAERYGRAAGQEAIYLRDTSRNVTIRPVPIA